MIVRHPLARLLSAYLGKVVRKPAPFMWPLRYNASTGFAGFVSAVTRATDLDGHFALMQHRCDIPRGMRYRVLRGEELDHWYREFVCALSLSPAVASGWTQWASTHDSAQDGGTQQCFVKTSDCGCQVDCGGAECNGSPSGQRTSISRKLPALRTFNNATALMDRYYDRHLAAQANWWAKNDLAMFGYRPWYPGRPLMGRTDVRWTGAVMPRIIESAGHGFRGRPWYPGQSR